MRNDRKAGTWHQVQAEQLSECTLHGALQFASVCLKGVGPVLQFIDLLGASSGLCAVSLVGCRVGSPKLSQMRCLLLYVCVLAGRKDTPNQNAGGRIVFSVSIGCSSNPKADRRSHLPAMARYSGFFPCKMHPVALGPEVLGGLPC